MSSYVISSRVVLYARGTKNVLEGEGIAVPSLLLLVKGEVKRFGDEGLNLYLTVAPSFYVTRVWNTLLGELHLFLLYSYLEE